jgi:hypothetical protein
MAKKNGRLASSRTMLHSTAPVALQHLAELFFEVEIIDV